MKLNTRFLKLKKGMTLIELTVVILVLLSLISILFIGARAYKRGSDRAGCVLNIRNVQQAVRSHQNMYNKTAANPTATPAVAGETLDFDEIYSTATVEKYLKAPTCPAGGSYTPSPVYPAVGTLAITCDLSTSLDHEPDADKAVKHADW